MIDEREARYVPPSSSSPFRSSSRGMSTRLSSPRLRVVTLVLGCARFFGTAIWLAAPP
jgi:hypothetical protein